jgi:hypothetical protein
MKNSNQSAFPAQDPMVDPRNYSVISGGLTKIEYLSGLAMQGLLANALSFEKSPHLLARTAHISAIALLAELEKETVNQSTPQP